MRKDMRFRMEVKQIWNISVIINLLWGRILLAADSVGLTGLWFEGQKYFALHLGKDHGEKEIPVLKSAKHWLDIYFSREEPAFTVPLHLIGTDFQKSVWDILRAIPYGRTVTYGEIAKASPVREGCRICPPRP